MRVQDKSSFTIVNWGNRQGLPWSEEDTDRLLRLHRESGGNWRFITPLFPDRTREACISKYNHWARSQVPQRGPEHERALALAAARRDAQHTNLTAMLCGDPLPGRSALDMLAFRRGPVISLAPIHAMQRSAS